MAFRSAVIAAVLAFLAPAPAAMAQDAGRGILEEIRPDALVGMPVRSSDGAVVGEIAEVTGSEAGAAQVLVATEGPLGIGGKTIALDPGHLTFDPEAGSVAVDLTADQLDGLPEYEG